MKRLTFMACVAALTLCLAGGPQPAWAQEETDQNQDQNEQDRNQQEEEEQARQQEEERERQEQQQRQRQQREQQQQQREQQQERERQQQQRERQQQQQQNRQQQSQFEDDYQQDQRFQTEQRNQQNQRFGSAEEDQRFRQETQFQGRSQQQLQLGARFEDYGDRLVISDVRDQSLAAQAGLEAQDVIVSVDGRPVRTQDQFQQLLVTRQEQGGRVPVVIIRDGERETVYLDLGRQSRDDRRFPRDSDYYGGEEAWLGVILDPRYEDYSVVRRVYPGSAADQAGIREGDWIVGVNNRRVQSPGHLSQIISNMRPGEQINVQVARRVTQSVSARLGDMSERFDDSYARGPQDRFQGRADQRFQSEFQTEDEFRSGYRGFDEQDVYQEEGFQQQQQQPQQDRGVLRDRFNRDQERGLRDRLDRGRDRLFDNRNQDQ